MQTLRLGSVPSLDLQTCIRPPARDVQSGPHRPVHKWSVGSPASSVPWLSITCKTVQFSSVQSLSRVRLCDPMNRSTPDLPVYHQLPESPQTHVHWVGDAIQAISSSVVPFSWPQTLPASGSFPMSQLFAKPLACNNSIKLVPSCSSAGKNITLKIRTTANQGWPTSVRTTMWPGNLGEPQTVLNMLLLRISPVPISCYSQSSHSAKFLLSSTTYPCWCKF